MLLCKIAMINYLWWIYNSFFCCVYMYVSYLSVCSVLADFSIKHFVAKEQPNLNTTS